MNCREVKTWFDNLLTEADRADLPEEIADHIAHCPSCAREAEFAKSTLTSIQLSHELQSSTQLKERIMRAINDANRMETARLVNTAGRKKTHGFRWLSATALAALLVVLGLFLYPGRQGSGLAFAQVLAQIDQIHSATWNNIDQNQDGSEVTSQRMWKEPGKFRQNWYSGVVTIFDNSQGKVLTLIPREKKYIEGPADPGINIIEYCKTLKEKAFETLGEKELDGHKVKGFHVIEPESKASWEWDTVIWADVETGYPVRIEHDHHDDTNTVHTYNKDFQFNVPLDDSLFSLVPPPDYTPEK